MIVASSVGDMDSMFDEEASSDDETVNSDVRTIRKQLEGLETMYSEVRNQRSACFAPSNQSTTCAGTQITRRP